MVRAKRVGGTSQVPAVVAHVAMTKKLAKQSFIVDDEKLCVRRPLSDVLVAWNAAHPDSRVKSGGPRRFS